MRRITMAVVGVTALGMVTPGLGGVALAEVTPSEQDRAATAAPALSSEFQAFDPDSFQGIRADEVIGRTVRNPEGERLGDVEDLLLPAHGDARALIGFGGLLGFGRRLVSVPIDALVLMDPDDVLLHASRDQLREAARQEAAGQERGPGDVSSAVPASPSQAERDSYVREQKSQLDAWAERLERLQEESKAAGGAMATEARERLDGAWSSLQTRWRELQGAGAATWAATRRSFERAWEEFHEAWDETTGEPDARES
jgi:hypothetical protein